MDLLTAKRQFTEARKIADATYSDLIDASDRMDAARSEYDLKQAVAAFKIAGIAHDEATERVKEAGRIHRNLMAGLSAIGGRG